MTMQSTPCFASTCTIRSGWNSRTDRVSHLREPVHRAAEPAGALVGSQTVERLRLPDVGVVVRRQLDDQLEAAETHQPLDGLQRRRAATGLEPGDCRLRRGRALGELALRQPGTLAGLPYQLATDHARSIALSLYIPTGLLNR